MFIDHIEISVSDSKKSIEFYKAALAPLGLKLVADIEGWVGFGNQEKADFWFGTDEKVHPPMHIAFRAQSRDQVDQFYRAAIAAGGKDNGMPGLRNHYHAHYYAAFIIDPDGHNIEAVCHKPH